MTSALPEELILLKNAERYLKALPYKNRWELMQDDCQKKMQGSEAEFNKCKAMLSITLKHNVWYYIRKS
jgi:hypothetical protein